MKNIEHLEAFFPVVHKKTKREWASPCPFCDKDETSVHKGQAWFTGDDRLIWFLANGVFWCRTCGTHSLRDVLSILGLEEETYVLLSSGEFENPIRGLWSDEDVEKAHQNVDRSFWKRFGWTDEVIDRFKLGHGILYQKDGPGHIIPMIISKYDQVANNTTHRWYISCRVPGIPAKRNQGSSRGYWWVAQRTDSPTWVFAEGEKDAITATLIYPEYNVVAIFGAGDTNESQVFNAARLGAQHIIVLGDNDSAGGAFSKFYLDYAAMSKLDYSYLEWPSDLPIGYDITDAYANSFDITPHVVFMSWRSLSVSQDYFVPYITKRDENPFFFGQETTLESLRDLDHPDSLFRRVNNFLTNSGRGDVFVLAAPPGSGKTHALVQNINQYAAESFKRTTADYEAMCESLEDLQNRLPTMTDKEEVELTKKSIERLESSISNFSHAKVAWLTLFKSGYDELLSVGLSPELSYNFQARNKENCENFDYASQLAAANHDVGKFCELGCPFKKLCEVRGYLSQREGLMKRPVTIYRHNHIMMSTMSKYDLLIVDENIANVFDSAPLMISSSDLDPHDTNWDFNEVNSYAVQDIRLFVSVLKSYLSSSSSDDDPLSDEDPRLHSDFHEIYKSLDRLTKQKEPDLSFRDLVFRLDESVLIRSYQPTSINQVVYPKPLKRSIHTLYKTLLSIFMGNYEVPDIAYPITRVANLLCVFSTEMPKVKRSAKIVVADATGSPLVAEAVFQRASQVYAPSVFDENTQTVVVYGSDWTSTRLNRDLGSVFVAREKYKKSSDMRITNVLGEDFDLEDIVLGEEITDKKIVQDASVIIRGLSARHSSLLVVTRKKFAELLKDTVGGLNVAYAHFNSLRGSNVYKDFEAVVIIGAYRIPPLILRQKIQYWAFLSGLKEPIPSETVRKTVQYHTQVSGYTYWTYTSQFADQFVHQVEAGEMIQCAERIRPHTSPGQRKFVYCVASRPAMRAVTRVISKPEFIKELTGRPSLVDMEDYVYSEAVRTYDSFGKIALPTYRELADKYAVSFSTIKEVVYRVKERVIKERSV